MNRSPLPPRLTASTEQARWLNKLRDAVESMRPVDGSHTRVIESTRGTSILASARSVAVEGGGGGMNFVGEWSSTSNYVADDVVVIRGGTEAGTYICVRQVTADAADISLQPGQGVYWASLSRAHPLGVWR